jgi:mRNA-degrading endonuclease RelE of RelBE toxin-antitoxin system
MVIKIAEISKDIDTLPEEAQILLLDFIQLLKNRYSQPENHHQEKRHLPRNSKTSFKKIQ